MTQAKKFTKGVCFSFTLNNPDEKLDPSKLLDPGKDKILFARWQFEVGDEGTPHYQGHVRMKVRKGATSQYRVLECIALFDKRYGTPWLGAIKVAELASIRYAGKSDKTYRAGPWDIGVVPTTQQEIDVIHKEAGELVQENKWDEFWMGECLSMATDALRSTRKMTVVQFCEMWGNIEACAVGRAKFRE